MLETVSYLSSFDKVDRTLVPSIIWFTATGLIFGEFHACPSDQPGKDHKQRYYGDVMESTLTISFC